MIILSRKVEVIRLSTKGPYTGQTGQESSHISSIAPWKGSKGDIKETMGTFLNRAINAPNVPTKDDFDVKIVRICWD